MQSWLEWARGPAFWFSLVFLILGLARHVALTVWETARSMRRTSDKKIPWQRLIKATAKWLFPIGKLKDRFVYGLLSLGLHIAVLLLPVFLAGHIALWRRWLGWGWPAIPNELADGLTYVGIASALGLIVARVWLKQVRAMSRFSDYAIPFLIALPFASGILIAHPLANPFGFETTYFIHVMSANLLMIVIPLTKLSHCALMPSGQIVSEVVWHFAPDAGRKVGVALGKEGEPV